MHIVVVGGGRLGSQVAGMSISEGHDTVIIERDKDRCADLMKALDCLVIRGDGASRGALIDAGAASADFVVAATGQDEANILACMAAKGLGAKKAAARVSNEEYSKNELSRLGVDFAVCPERVAAGYFTAMMMAKAKR